MSINTKKYIEAFLKIKTKEGKIIPFKLNQPQQKCYEVIRQQYLEKKPIRIIILKARQMGFSTLTEAIIFKNTATNPNVSSGIVAHIEEATSNLFNMSNLFFQELPEKIKPKVRQSNAKELIFDDKDKNKTGLRSKIKCMTAGGKGIGRSDTFQNLHISEYAFWPGDKKGTLAGLLQAVPDSPNSMVIIESTANGYDDFKKRWDDAVEGKSDYYPLFCAWHELDSYRKTADGIILTSKEKELKRLYNLDNEQIAWRRWKIANDCGGDEDVFRQEFPSCPEEAFLSSGSSVFDKDLIIRQIENIKDKKPYSKGYFEYKKEVIDTINYKISDIKWKRDERGYITIHYPPERYFDTRGNLIKYAPYVIGVDISGMGSDYNAAKVVNNITKSTCATLHIQNINEDLLADQLYCLGKYFNEALIGVETNYSILTNRELEKLNYPNLYYREKFDSASFNHIKVRGFETNQKTRPLMIGELTKLLREDVTKECDKNTLKECLSFVKNSNGRPEAENGSHDDLVIARAICTLIGEQQEQNYINIKVEESTLPFALQSEKNIQDEEDDIFYQSMFFEKN
ncbi:MAG: hypothetical protein IJW82_05945 [Clostridia bacterium]|nr:hypothetical protein [Clostridia bacterium]